MIKKTVEAVKRAFSKKPIKVAAGEPEAVAVAPVTVSVPIPEKQPKPRDTHADIPVPVRGGVFVAVTLDGGFGEISNEMRGHPHCLQISDLALSSAGQWLAGRRINWAIIPFRARHNLEIHRFHIVNSKDLEKYLKEA